MSRVNPTICCKAPLAAIAMVVLPALSSCGKSVAPSSREVAVNLPPAVEVAIGSSITGKVTLSGGKPSGLGKVIDVGNNPFCSGHGKLINPTWRVSEDGGLADAVVSVRQNSRASNEVPEFTIIDQVNCEFSPYMSVLQAGQKVRFHNGDLTFHNVRLVRHTIGTRAEGANLENFGQPAKGDQNVKAFDVPGIYRLECDVHRWMKAWVYVHDGIHAASSKADGTYAINRVLADGVYEVEVWHPQFAEKLTQTVNVRQGKAEANFEFILAKSFDP